MCFCLLIFSLLFIFSNVSSECNIEDRPCRTVNGTNGYCVSPKDCPYMQWLIKSSNPNNTEFVKNSICGYDVDNSRLYCCDKNGIITFTPDHANKGFASAASSSSVLILHAPNLLQSARPEQHPESHIIANNPASGVQAIASASASSFIAGGTGNVDQTVCRTPNGERAYCRALISCSAMQSISQNHDQTSTEQKRFIQESICESRNNKIFVCCGSDVNFRKFIGDEYNLNYPFNPLIPSDVCGVQIASSIDTIATSRQPRNNTEVINRNFTLPNRVFGGTDTDIDEFPWVALLEYAPVPNGPRLFACGGSLISSRYVLTAAHCILGQNALSITSVRLGEWNHQKTGRQCVASAKGQICQEAINVGIDQLYPHPSYTRGVREKYNDIGLIRLNVDVPFTNHIKPVCLPTPGDYVAPEERLTLSGWGIKNYNEETSIKQKVELPVIATSQCSIMFEKTLGLTLGRGQFCAGGEEGRDACVGDSGSPLMKRIISPTTGNYRWTIEGIVSFGHGCGAADVYGVYTKVSMYIGWIHRTIVK